MKLIILLLLGASANCADYDRCKNDCYYYNFTKLLAVSRNSRSAQIFRCILSLPKGSKAFEIFRQIYADGTQMRNFVYLGKLCERTQATLKDMRDCQAPSIENVVKYAENVLVSLKQLRDDIQTDAPTLNDHCVEMATKWPIAHLTEALEC